MSKAKRHNDLFRLAKTAGDAAPCPVPRDRVSRPERAVQTLAVQGSWSAGTIQGSDPYNSAGAGRRS